MQTWLMRATANEMVAVLDGFAVGRRPAGLRPLQRLQHVCAEHAARPATSQEASSSGAGQEREGHGGPNRRGAEETG